MIQDLWYKIIKVDKKNSNKKVKLHYLYMNHYEGGRSITLKK